MCILRPVAISWKLTPKVFWMHFFALCYRRKRKMRSTHSVWKSPKMTQLQITMSTFSAKTPHCWNLNLIAILQKETFWMIFKHCALAAKASILNCCNLLLQSSQGFKIVVECFNQSWSSKHFWACFMTPYNFITLGICNEKAILNVHCVKDLHCIAFIRLKSKPVCFWLERHLANLEEI